MPIYEYECRSCAHHYEKKQKFHDAPEKECPKCSGKVRRLIRPAPVIYKASGFYVTDSVKQKKGSLDAAKGEMDKAKSEKPKKEDLP